MSTARRAGTAFETCVVQYLQAHGFPMAERRALRGALDCGDVLGVPGWVVEAKAARGHDLAGWVAEAEAERRNAGERWSAVVVKRRQRPTADAFVVLSLRTFVEAIAGDPVADLPARAAPGGGGAGGGGSWLRC